MINLPVIPPSLKCADRQTIDCGPEGDKEKQPETNRIRVWIGPQAHCRQSDDRKQRPPSEQHQGQPDLVHAVGKEPSHVKLLLDAVNDQVQGPAEHLCACLAETAGQFTNPARSRRMMRVQPCRPGSTRAYRVAPAGAGLLGCTSNPVWTGAPHWRACR